ncbi:MAG TPA: hypothetical protein VFS83_19490 [Ktedonobacterales bacterium]|nr:hypothetical protein [Ktedonobacterales bacterium]
MVGNPRQTRAVTQPLTARPAWWGCGGLAVGAAIGALVMLLALIAFAPRPQAASPGAGGQNGNLVINMDDTYLTTQVSAAIGQAKLPITLSNIKAEILPGNQVKLSADTDSAFPLGAHLEAVAQVRIESGQLAMHLISAQVGGLPLPAPITSALERPMNERMQEVSAVLLPPGYVMTAISSTEHHLLMTISNHPG